MHATAAIVAVVDTSLPGQAGRAWQMTQLGSIEKSASEAHYLLDVWSSARVPTHLWGPTQPLAEDQVEASIGTALDPSAPTARRESNPGAALSAIGNQPRLNRLQDVRILILTDGTVTGRAGWAALKFGARSFASRPGWRIEVLGISPQNEARWRAALTPVLGARFDLVGQRATSLLQENRDE